MKALTVLLALLALALAASAALSPGPLLLLAAVALAVRAVEELWALNLWVSRPPVAQLVEHPSAGGRGFESRSGNGSPAEQVIATIYLRSGRLRLRRRQPSSGGD